NANRRDRRDVSAQRSGVIRPVAASITVDVPASNSPSISITSVPFEIRKSSPGPTTSHDGRTGPAPSIVTSNSPTTTDWASTTGKNSTVLDRNGLEPGFTCNDTSRSGPSHHGSGHSNVSPSVCQNPWNPSP